MTTELSYEVKSLQTLREEMDKRSHLERVQLQQKIDALKAFQDEMATREAILFAKLPLVISALEKLGLGIGTLGYFKSGMNSNKWEKQDCLKVSITAYSISGKFKFIKDTGFTAKGAGKNQKQLDAKAEKMTKFISEETKIESVHVNCFSLEYKDENDVKQVLIDLYI